MRISDWSSDVCSSDLLPGRKIIYTNASADHAERVMERLGISRHFSGVFDIIEAGYLPKPDAAGYATVIERFGIAPGKAAMVDRKSVVLGKSVSVRVDLGGRRIMKKKKCMTNQI